MQLHGRVQAALDGHGQVVLLAGEPGVGKSRLAEEIAGHVSELACGSGRAAREEGSPPYWVSGKCYATWRR